MTLTQNPGVCVQCGTRARSKWRRSSSALMACWSAAGTRPSLSQFSTRSNSSSVSVRNSCAVSLTTFKPGKSNPFMPALLHRLQSSVARHAL